MVLDQMLTALHSQDPEENVLSPEFRRQLDDLAVKCAEDRATLLDYAISTREALAGQAVRVRLLDILTELNQGISDDTEDEICKDAFDLYAELHAGG